MAAFTDKLATEYPQLEEDLRADSNLKLNTLVTTPMETKSWIHRFIGRHDFLNRRFPPVSISSKFLQSCVSLLLPCSSICVAVSYSEARNLI
jgi:hypothetical protein